MKRAPVILIGIAVVSLGSYVAFSNVVRPPSTTVSTARSVARDRAEPSSDKSADAAEEVAALRARMARLNAEVSALREQMAENQASADADASAVNPEPEPEPVRRDPAERAQQMREWHAHMMDVDSDFQSEATDSRWASSTASAVQRAFNASDEMRGTMRSVECRSQTCRVELDDDGSGEMSKELPMFVNQFAETLPNVQADHIDDGTGRKTIVLYMTRNDGAQSPTAEMSRR